MKIVQVLMQSSFLTRRACHLTFVCPNCILCHRIFIFRVYLEDTDDMALCLSQLFDSSQPGFQSYFYHLAPVKTLGFFNLRLAKLKRIYYQISKRYPEVRRSLGTACQASGPFFFFFFSDVLDMPSLILGLVVTHVQEFWGLH